MKRIEPFLYSLQVKSRPALHLFSFLFFLLLTLFWLRPLPYHFTTALPGRDDLWLQFWNQWWMEKSLLELGRSPFFTDFAWYPTGVDLHFHALSPLNSLLALPLRKLFGPVAAFNTLFTATFVLSGYGTFLFAHDLTKRFAPSLLAGYIVAFSPYHFLHLYQLEHLSIQWFPFFLMFLFRMTRGDRARRSAVLAGLFFLFAFYSNYYYGVSAGILAALLFATDIFGRPSLRAPRPFPSPRGGGVFLRWGIFAVVVLAGILPFLPGMLRAQGEPGRFKVPLAVNIHQSLDLLSFFTPSFANPLLSGWVPWMKLYERFTGMETVGFLGFSALILAALGALGYHGSRRGILALTAILFATLALGPVLHVAGETKWSWGGPIPLPQFLLQVLPVVSRARVPARYLAVAMVPLAVLAGMGFEALRAGGGRPGRVFAVALVSLLLVEYAVRPLELSIPERAAWTRFIAADPEDCAVMTLPFRLSKDPAQWWKAADPYAHGWNDTLHGKRSLTGAISHTALTRRNFLFFLESRYLEPLVTGAEDLERREARDGGVEGYMKELGLKYFVMERGRYSSEREFERDRVFFTGRWGLKKVYEDSEAVVVRAYENRGREVGKVLRKF